MKTHSPLNITAIVPMRHDSERVHGKNYRLCNGLPLYHWIIKSLLGSKLITSIVIDTDSKTILEDAQKHFPSVILNKRPEHLRSGHISMNAVIANTIINIDTDYILQTHSTNPLLSSSTIDKGLKLFLEKIKNYDSLFSVTKMQTRLWDNNNKPVNHDPKVLLRTQDLAPIYEENSCLYVFSKKLFLETNNRMSGNMMMYPIDCREALDIDEELDFEIAEFMLHKKNK